MSRPGRLERGWRAVWGELRYLYFSLFQRHRHDRLVIERVAGFPLLVLPRVFNPALLHTGALLAAALDRTLVADGAHVLDMGTGSGAVAVAAARLGGRVVAVDANPHAVRCARINALLNRCEERLEVRQGDLFAPVAGERFDLVTCNPPYLRGAPRDLLDQAWRSTDFGERFAAALPAHLRPGGRGLVLLSSAGDEPGFLAAFRAAGLAAAVHSRRDFLWERVTLYRLVAA